MRTLLFTIASLCASAPALAQTSPEPLPANYIRVNAPMAQRLTLRIKAAHPEITKLGLHATPDGGTDNAIIACDIPSKIGKKSSDADMQHLAGRQPFVVRIDKDGIYDLMLPIADSHGKSIGQGFVVMEVPLKNAASEQDALRIGTTIRDEMQRAIPGKAALYRE